MKRLVVAFGVVFVLGAPVASAAPDQQSGPPPHGCAQADQEGVGGAYHSTCDGSPSQNGNGDGEATGRPCAGCVGAADNKNPPGQAPDGTDPNNGYECDGNNGVGKTNPAHTGCITEPYSGARVQTEGKARPSGASTSKDARLAGYESADRPWDVTGRTLVVIATVAAAAFATSLVVRRLTRR